MKKLVTFTLSLFCLNAMADDVKMNTASEPPMAFINVLDTSVKPEKVLSGDSLSRSKPRKVCAHIKNVEIQKQNQLAIYFQAPNTIELNVENGSIQAEDNHKNYLVLFQLSDRDIQNNVVSQCFTFGKEDPIGKYKIDLQFNNTVFKDISFNVTK